MWIDTVLIFILAFIIQQLLSLVQRLTHQNQNMANTMQAGRKCMFQMGHF